MPLNDTPDAPQLKECTKCHEWLPATAEYFSRKKERASGLHAACKKCCRSFYAANRERVLARRNELAILNKEKYQASPRENGYKVCAKCKEAKPDTADYFHRDVKCPDGLRGTCKACLVAGHLPPPRDGYKRCTRCRIEKLPTADNFHQDSSRKDGFFPWCKKCQEKYRVANAPQISAKKSEWTRANKDKGREAHGRRRARKLDAGGSHTAADIRLQYKAQRGKCYYCAKKVGKKYHADHVIPLVRGGSNGPENIVIACPTCNISKGSKLPSEWEGSNRLL